MSDYTFSTEAPVCPYCNKSQSHDGAFFFNENLTECECGHCDRTFGIEVFHSTSWTCTARTEAGKGEG